MDVLLYMQNKKRVSYVMSKTTDLIEKLSQESEEFNKSYKDAKLHSDFIDIIYELKDEYDLSNSQVALKQIKIGRQLIVSLLAK